MTNRTDTPILIRNPHRHDKPPASQANPLVKQLHASCHWGAVEVKVWRDQDKKGDPLPMGLKQLNDYLSRLGLEKGTLVIFDCRSKAEPIDDRTRFESHMTASGRKVTLLRA